MQFEYKDTLLRHRDLLPLEVLGSPITVIGAGAVGSWTVLALVKMGFANVKVIDFDTIEPHNLGSQFYPMESVGEKKVIALQKMVESFTGIKIQVDEQPYKGEPLNTQFVIAAVDNMGVRKQAFQACGASVKWFLDPRMGAESLALYTYNPSDPLDVEAYDKSWYSDEDAVHEPCTAKATIYCANILSGIIAANIKKLATSEKYSRILQFDIPSMGFNNWGPVVTQQSN